MCILQIYQTSPLRPQFFLLSLQPQEGVELSQIMAAWDEVEYMYKIGIIRYKLQTSC